MKIDSLSIQSIWLVKYLDRPYSDQLNRQLGTKKFVKMVGQRRTGLNNHSTKPLAGHIQLVKIAI